MANRINKKCPNTLRLNGLCLKKRPNKGCFNKGTSGLDFLNLLTIVFKNEKLDFPKIDTN